MNKRKIISAILLLALMLGLTLHAGAASEGTKDMAEAAGGKNILMFPLYLDGGDGFNDAEGSASLFDYDEKSKTGPKYCTDQLPYYAEWKYEKAYIVERIILRTGNDSKSNPRRMGDGWTLSGSNDGKDWKVIYTGKEDDVLNENNTYYYVDLPDNKDAYQYYRLYSEEAGIDEKQDRNLIQLSMFILCVNESVEVPAERPYIPRSYTIGSTTTIIEAPDFDSGKYFESKASDGEHKCRPEEEVQTQFCGDAYIGRTNDEGEPLDGTLLGNIGWTAVGEWVQYTVDVKKDGVYLFSAWVASENDPPGSADIYLVVDGVDKMIGSAESLKDKWQTYTKVEAGSIDMTAGTNVIKVVFPTGSINFQALEIKRTGDIPPPPEPETVAPDPGNGDSGETAVDNPDASGEDKSAASDGEGNSGSFIADNLILIIVIGAVVLVVIIAVIIVVATKKKKQA